MATDAARTGTGLRTSALASAFRATSSSYKYYWFLALLDALPHLEHPVPVERVIRAMIIRAWFSVAQYRLSLGLTDRLQQCVTELQAHTGLGAAEPRSNIDVALDGWAEWPRWAEELSRFVPGRFLGAWFPDLARARPYDRRGARDVATASDRAWGTSSEGPYRLYDDGGRQMVEVSGPWLAWLNEHVGLVRGHAELQLCRYLQARNPGVPGIVDKLEPPGRRALSEPRRWWKALVARGGVFATDLYTGRPIEPGFDLDHFRPWTFVAYDEPWNLIPTSASINRSKGDRIPDLSIFLPKLARLHAEVISTSALPPGTAHSYSEFLGLEIGGDHAPSAEAVIDRYMERVTPLAQIATNQGFPGGWSPS